MVYVPNLASLVPTSIWPETEGKRKVPTRNEATVGEFERLTRTLFSIVNLHINLPMHVGHMTMSNLLCKTTKAQGVSLP